MESSEPSRSAVAPRVGLPSPSAPFVDPWAITRATGNAAQTTAPTIASGRSSAVNGLAQASVALGARHPGRHEADAGCEDDEHKGHLEALVLPRLERAEQRAHSAQVSRRPPGRRRRHQEGERPQLRARRCGGDQHADAAGQGDERAAREREVQPHARRHRAGGGERRAAIAPRVRSPTMRPQRTSADRGEHAHPVPVGQRLLEPAGGGEAPVEAYQAREGPARRARSRPRPARPARAPARRLAPRRVVAGAPSRPPPRRDRRSSRCTSSIAAPRTGVHVIDSAVHAARPASRRDCEPGDPRPGQWSPASTAAATTRAQAPSPAQRNDSSKYPPEKKPSAVGPARRSAVTSAWRTPRVARGDAVEVVTGRRAPPGRRERAIVGPARCPRACETRVTWSCPPGCRPARRAPSGLSCAPRPVDSDTGTGRATSPFARSRGLAARVCPARTTDRE